MHCVKWEIRWKRGPGWVARRTGGCHANHPAIAWVNAAAMAATIAVSEPHVEGAGELTVYIKLLGPGGFDWEEGRRYLKAEKLGDRVDYLDREAEAAYQDVFGEGGKETSKSRKEPRKGGKDAS